MAGIRRSKLVLGIFIPFLAFFLMSHNTFAVSLSGLNFLKVSYSFNGGSFQELIRHNQYFNLPDTLLAVPANASSEQMNYFVVSGNIPSSMTGSYFNSSVYFEILANADNSFNSLNCKGISGYIFPEQGTVTDHQSRSECNVSNNGRILNVAIITSGKLQSEITPSSWYASVENLDNYLFSCSSSAGSMSAPCRQQQIQINSGVLNFTLSRDQTVAGLDNIINQNQTIINQNETIINNQNENTDAIINNQNENTDAIIKSNQNCRMSKNLFYGRNTTSGGITSTWSGSEVTLNGVASSSYANITSVLDLPIQAGTYTFSLDDPTGLFRPALRVNYGGTSHDFKIAKNTKSVTFTVPDDGFYRLLFIDQLSSGTDYSGTYRFQLEKGSMATQYEPYGEEICKNINEEYYDEQRQADQNISNQSVSDIQGAENQATTNLIGVLSGFISAFSNINATNCNLTLDFPNYAGGTRVVNICSGKEKAPRIVEIGSSLLLIGVFVPLAYILIKMIYNEIRSWTNG